MYYGLSLKEDKNMKRLLFLLIFPILAYAGFPATQRLNGPCERVGFRLAHQDFITFFEQVHKSRRDKKQFQDRVTNLFATRKNNRQVLRSLIRQGHINSPLLSALVHRSSASKTIRLIQEQPGVLDGLFGTAGFFLMVKMGYREMVILSLEHRPHLARLKTKEKDQPLSYSTDPEITEALIVYGAPINSWNKTGRTALYYAANKEVAEVLIHYGADLTMKDYSGLSPLEYHKQFVRDNKIISLLEAKQQESREEHIREKNHSLRSLRKRNKTQEEKEAQAQQLKLKRAEILKQSAFASQRRKREKEDRERQRRENSVLKAKNRERERAKNQLKVVQQRKLKISQQIEKLQWQAKVLNTPDLQTKNNWMVVLKTSKRFRALLPHGKKVVKTQEFPEWYFDLLEEVRQEILSDMEEHKKDLNKQLDTLEKKEQELSLALQES